MKYLAALSTLLLFACDPKGTCLDLNTPYPSCTANMKKSICEKMPNSRQFYEESPPTGATCVLHGFGSAVTMNYHQLTPEQLAQEFAKGNSVMFQQHP